ncbi:MAG: hypothetical protein R3A51_13755, partial [Nannocystaceae bacterium]
PREGGPPWNEWLTGIWARLAGHRAMRPTAIYLAAALTAADRLYLLDRVLVRLTARELPVLDVAASDGAPPSEAVSSDN